MTAQTAEQFGTLDLVTHSPDGESRGVLVREGDFFSMLPTEHILSASDTSATSVRPWGLRFLRVPTPRAGKHGSPKKTKEVSTQDDGQSAEEVQAD